VLNLLQNSLLVPAFGSARAWQGRSSEDFEVGDVYVHPLGRTVTTTDNL
jgi:itaconyl-CoA hydratase